MATRHPRISLSARELVELRKTALMAAATAAGPAVAIASPMELANATVIMADRFMQFLTSGDGKR